METKLYNADAEQYVTLGLVAGGERYDIKFKFLALADTDSIEQVNLQNSDDADSARLFKKLVIGAEGCEDEDGNAFSPEALGELIPVEDQRYAIDAALMGTRFLPAPKAARKLNLRQMPEQSVYRMAVYFDGEEIITEHKMNLTTAGQQRVFRALESLQFPIQFGDHEIRSYGWGLVRLYDAMQCTASGYAGRIPAHHKMVVAAAHLRGQRQIVMGK